MKPDPAAARTRRRTIAALAAGIALGATASAGVALLLYTGQGFLRAAGLLVSSTIMAVAAGLWAGAPEPDQATAGSIRARWTMLIVALLAGGVFTAFWNARASVRGLAWGGALAVLLVLALPAYTAGSLFAGLHSQERRRGAGATAAAAMAGSAFGILLAAAVLIQTVDPYGIYYGGAALLTIISLRDRGRLYNPPASGGIDMADRVVIVTGAAERGQLGFTIARTFLDAGAHVVISARSDSIDAAAADLAQHGDVLAVRADLTNDQDVARIIDAVRERFGRIDALINVAGGLSVFASVQDTSPEEWQREIERNAGTALRMCRAALPLLRESRGAIVNFTSPAAARAPAKLAAYSAAKAAVIALTRALAIEEKTNGVRVNAIAPGPLDTDQNRSSMPDATSFVSRVDVAAVTLFLAGAGAAGVTGETVHVLGDSIQ